jgi:hypothetical protein
MRPPSDQTGLEHPIVTSRPVNMFLEIHSGPRQALEDESEARIVAVLLPTFQDDQNKVQIRETSQIVFPMYNSPICNVQKSDHLLRTHDKGHTNYLIRFSYKRCKLALFAMTYAHDIPCPCSDRLER